jgi:Protein of unknown function (DUF3309)
LYTLLLVALIVLMIAAYPAWPYSRRWGYLPSAALGALLLLALIGALLGRL